MSAIGFIVCSQVPEKAQLVRVGGGEGQDWRRRQVAPARVPVPRVQPRADLEHGLALQPAAPHGPDAHGAHQRLRGGLVQATGREEE